MKEKKFPVLPVSILGVAIVGGAIMISNKPLVGDMEAVMKAKAEREQAQQEDAARQKIAGDSRTAPSDLQLKKELETSMKTETKGNAGPRDGAPKTPLITQGVRHQVLKVPVNEAIPAQGWYKTEYRGEKKK